MTRLRTLLQSWESHRSGTRAGAAKRQAMG
jgi:hypothetical protein